MAHLPDEAVAFRSLILFAPREARVGWRFGPSDLSTTEDYIRAVERSVQGSRKKAFAQFCMYILPQDSHQLLDCCMPQLGAVAGPGAVDRRVGIIGRRSP